MSFAALNDANAAAQRLSKSLTNKASVDLGARLLD
jgi:hypothetical protein